MKYGGPINTFMVEQYFTHGLYIELGSCPETLVKEPK
jgi:hypothetical protein